MYKIKFCETTPGLKARQAANKIALDKENLLRMQARHYYADLHGPIIYKPDPALLKVFKMKKLKKFMRDLLSHGKRARRRKFGA